MRISRHGFILLIISAITFPASSQDKSAESKTEIKQDKTDQQDPLKRPLSDRDRKQRAADKIKGDSPYRNWVKQEVPWIITEEEREAFARLTNDDEREKFIELFWDHRDPTPDTVENEYKDDYYRRVLYANEHFSSGIAGIADRSRPYVHCVGAAGRNRFAPDWGNL